jgi:hypothetical protein
MFFSATNPGLVTIWILTLNIIIFIAMVLARFGFISFASDDLLCLKQYLASANKQPWL